MRYLKPIPKGILAVTSAIMFTCMGCTVDIEDNDSTSNNDGEKPATSLAQHQQTVDFLESGVRSRGYTGNRALAYTRQSFIQGLLLLSEPNGLDYCDFYLLSVFLIDIDPKLFRFISLTWLGQDNAIPRFEVIGRAGQVVGTFEGVDHFEEPIGGYPETWIRTLPFVPILDDGSADEANGNSVYIYPTIRLSVESLQEIDGVRLVSDEHCCSRFTRAFMGGGVGEDVPSDRSAGESRDDEEEEHDEELEDLLGDPFEYDELEDLLGDPWGVNEGEKPGATP